MWNEDNKLIIEYSKEENINKSSYNKIIQIQTLFLISGDSALFVTDDDKVNVSSCWCYWCDLSAKAWYDKSHTKVMLWTVDYLKKSLNDKFINKNMTSY